MKVLRFTALMLAALGFFGSASASLITSGYLSGSNGKLITDTSTGLQWLVPTYTAGHTYDDSFVQNIVSTYGFTYATETQVESMINSNFNNPPTASPGTAAGYADVQAFFNVFGANDPFDTCSGGPCPRTQALTSTSTSSGYHDAVGMIQLGSNGWEIEANSWPDSISDSQMGSWLVRSAPLVAATPEPGGLLLLGTGIGFAFTIGLRRKRSEH